MGYWGTGILENDSSSDVYGTFYDLYNAGGEPGSITPRMVAIFSDPPALLEHSNYWFALSLALWETGALDKETLELATSLAPKDINEWKNTGASQSDILQRQADVEKFLNKISKPNKKPKERKPKKKILHPFRVGECVSLPLANGMYGAAYVLEAEEKSILQSLLPIAWLAPRPPTFEEFRMTPVLYNCATLEQSGDGRMPSHAFVLFNVFPEKDGSYLQACLPLGFIPINSLGVRVKGYTYNAKRFTCIVSSDIGSKISAEIFRLAQEFNSFHGKPSFTIEEAFKWTVQDQKIVELQTWKPCADYSKKAIPSDSH